MTDTHLGSGRGVGFYLLAFFFFCGAGCAAEPEVQEQVAESSLPVTNAVVVDPATHPYAAFLTLHFINGDSSVCSGSRIGPTQVLTAAHCLICTGSVEVTFVGDVDSTWQSASLAVHPDAFPSVGPALCLLPTEIWGSAVTADLENHLGSDLAVVHLESAPDDSVVPSAAVLLTPPFGFSPVQDLFGIEISLIGRGPPCVELTPSCGDLTRMRVGKTTLDRFWNTTFPAELPLGCDALSTTPFYLKTKDGSEVSNLLGGDSGGPALAIVADDQRVIAVNSSGNPAGKTSWLAPTFTHKNARFLRSELGLPTLPADLDEDNVSPGQDNCPLDYNPDQIDRDDDGWGDICDNCTRSLNASHPALQLDTFDPENEDPVLHAQMKNPSQSNANEEAESERVLKNTEHLGGSFVPPNEDALLDDGLIRHASAQDYFQYANGCGNLSAHDSSRLILATKYQRRGNQCDPVPTAEVHIEQVEADPDWVPSGPGALTLCPANGYAFGFPGSSTVPGELLFTPIVDAQSVALEGAPIPGEVGARYCVCDDPHATEQDRRLFCGAGTTRNCAVDSVRYAPPMPDQSWRKMQLDHGPSEVTPAAFSTETDPHVASVTWDAAQDAQDITGVEPGNGSFPEVEGIVWCSVRTLRGVPLEGTLDGNEFVGRDVDQIANHYAAADLAIETECGWKRLPIKRKMFPWEVIRVCPRCGLEPAARWLWILDDKAFSVGPRGSRDITPQVDALARQFLAGPWDRVLASEPESRLSRSRVLERELIVDPSNFNVIGKLAIVRGAVDGFELKGPRVLGESRTPVGLEGADAVFAGAMANGQVRAQSQMAAAYSAVRDELFVLAYVPPAKGASPAGATLGTWSRGRWFDRPLEGAAIGRPLSMAFHIESSSLYVVDQLHGVGSPLRLVRVDLVSDRVEVLVPTLLVGKYDDVSISIGDHSDLLLAASRTASGRIRLAHLRLDGAGVAVVDRLELVGESFAGEAREVGAGIGFLVRAGDGFEPRAVQRRDFVAAADGSPSPVFP